MILALVTFVLALVVAAAVGQILGLRRRNASQRARLLSGLGVEHPETKKIVGFFHPYCNAGGGGERVLWVAIAAIQRKDPDVISVVYSGDTDTTKHKIIQKVKARFDIELSLNTLDFVFLESRHLVEDSTWPRFTLLGQSIGSMYLVWEAMTHLIPDLFIDTMGYAFTFPVVSLLGNIPVGAYVHYPTISATMLSRVESRTAGVTNSAAISSSSVLSTGKLLYYRLFMYYYAYSLRQARFIMVNSSWTKNHVDSILRYTDPLLDAIHLLPPLVLLEILSRKRSDCPKTAQIVYPSCDTRQMAVFPLEGRERVILSIAQFRPEKDHAGQLRSFHKLLEAHPEYKGQGPSSVKLVLVGGSRNVGDATRVEELRLLAKELDIQDQTEFVVNASYPQVLNWLSRASIGLSTMVDEHFGINVVEFMAAGVIPVAHASGGPLLDIIVPLDGEPTGYHATSPETFAEAFHTVFTLSTESDIAMRKRARTWAVQKFSAEEFEKGWDESGWRRWL
ncbi:mannosyltransferase [Lentinus tigrinus ALCF2SS1-7]|uniref:GDP-Man:Man(3)GlcNAc(2)-PP-Dol alpha-1,2-mannosyltransferase n=1 Tax=Lentinus tigrinus ALCF2SS1-6 TaxID=1328759 RepID=A0A5C2RZV0_9APHY|nr:mannosyltransferase [Lentinus tigrinus ALCF2SS1-6]RPD71675.1 mannosyltransferase [Lentinus tigrinus ALCF2SS1-7]